MFFSVFNGLSDGFAVPQWIEAACKSHHAQALFVSDSVLTHVIPSPTQQFNKTISDTRCHDQTNDAAEHEFIAIHACGQNQEAQAVKQCG